MVRIIYDEEGVELINFGKFKGVSVEEVFEKEPGYFGWLMNGDFPMSTKKVFKEIMERMRRNRKATKVE